jgi:hypothetical protein
MRRAGSSLVAGLIALVGCGDPDALSTGATSPAPETTSADTSPLPDTTISTTTSLVTDTSTSTASTTTAIEVAPVFTTCVDATTQLAPSTPPGWQQFVLQAQPTGACGQPIFLMMSLVLPSGTSAPGTLVTIVTSPAGGAPAQAGEPVVIDGYTGTLQQSTMADGQPANIINIVLDAVAVDAHGSADVETLTAIVAGMHLVSDAEWAALVSSVQQP